MNIDCKIVGNYYLNEESKQYLRSLTKNTELLLVPDPDNSVDPNAIKVVLVNEENNQIHLGYIPKDINVDVLSAIQQGKKLRVIYKEKHGINIKDKDSPEINLFRVYTA